MEIVLKQEDQLFMSSNTHSFTLEINGTRIIHEFKFKYFYTNQKSFATIFLDSQFLILIISFKSKKSYESHTC